MKERYPTSFTLYDAYKKKKVKLFYSAPES